jgi:hypothetical protein
MIITIMLTYILSLTNASFKLTSVYIACAPSATIFFLDHLLSDFINFTIL